MRKTLLVIALLLGVVFLHKATSGQNAIERPSNDSTIIKPQHVSTNTKNGQSPYLTHPEFTNVMTATVTTAAQNTEDGYIFLAAIGQFYSGQSALLMIDDVGEPVYIKTFPNDIFLGDFKKQTVNGTDYLTYFGGHLGSGTSYVLDQNYQLVDTWTIDNGYGSDVHEFLLLNNGHAIQLAYVPTPFDLTPYGGPANGTIIDIVLQEQDENKNVVFEWIASEHLPIDDSEKNLNTTDPIDYLHTNGIAVDYDGNWLISSRHFSEITKINRQTGDVMWRMGGKGNEFTFTNDIGFWNQHNVNRLDTGTITLFDNGNQHNPRYSRAIEYIVDENAKTVTRLWMYPEDTSEYSSAMGDFQRLTMLPTSNSFIGWGSQPKLTEVQYDGTVALEMVLSGLSYRAFRFTWNGTPIDVPRAVIQYNADPMAVTLYTSWNGATDIISYEVFAGMTPATMFLVKNEPRNGFETTISLTGLPPNTCFFKTKPVHAQGNSTPYSNQTFRVDIPVCWDQLNHSFIPVSLN